MNNISITPKGGTVDTVVNGNQVNLTAPSVVKLHLNQSDIKSFTRNGNDLVVTTKSGEVVVIHNFYTTAGDSDLVLQDDKGALWWVEDPGTEGFQYVNIDTTEGLLAENTTNDGTIAAFGIGGAALAGLGAMFAGASGGGGGNAAVNDGNTGGGDNGGGNNGGGNNGGGNNGGGDTTAPGTVTDLAISDNVGPYQGAITAGSVTDDNTPTLSGSAEAGATVRIYDGSTLLGSAVVGADGKWTFTSPALADGSHSLTVTVTDAAGNTSAASDPINFTVDTTAPDAVSDLTVSNNAGSVVLPVTNGGSTNDTTPQLSGRGEAGSIITIRDGDTILGSVTVGSNGSWSFTSPELGQGSHTISITSTDAAGNTSAATTITFTVDTVAPAAATDLSMTGDANGTSSTVLNGGTTNDSTPTLSGQGEAGSVVSVYDNNTLIGTAVVGTDGTWSFTTPALSNGSHSLTVTQTDAAGNVGPASSAYDITVDAGLPPATTSLEITDDSGNTLVQLSNGDSTHDSTPTLSGLATAGAVITLYNGSEVIGSAVADSNGQWSFTPAALADGTYNFHASVTDADGNVTQTPNIAITIDTLAPDAAGGLQLSDNDNGTVQPIASGGATNTTTPHLSGTAEPGSTVTIRDGDTVLGTATVGSNGTWDFTSPTLSEGSHSLTTTVTDPAGNTSPATDPITFTVDTQAPAGASNLVVSDNVGATTGPLTAGATTDDSTPTLSGNAEANSIVKVYDGSTLLGSVATDGDGNWSFTTPTLSNGAHTLSVTVTDAAGNVSPATTGFGLTVNAGVPPTTSTLQVTDDSGSTLKVLPDGSSTHDKTPILSGLAAAGDIITLYNGTTVLGSTTAGADGQWSFTPASLADGTYAFQAVATDSTGNPTNSVTINITIDSVAPAAAGDLQLSDNNGSAVTPVTSGETTNDNTPVLSGTAEPGSTVTVLDGTNVLGSATVGSDGNWTFTSPALSEGNHSLTTTVTDAAGNTGPASSPITFTVDTTPPAAVSGVVVADNVGDSQGDLNSGDVTDDNTPTLSGTGEPNALLSIYDGTTLLGNVTVNTDGTWSFTTPALSNGSHSFTITATDAAGNVGPASPPFVVNIEAGLPTATTTLEVIDDNGNTVETLANGASTNDASPVLIGVTTPGNIVTLYDGTLLLGSTTAGSNGQWAYRISGLSDGPHSLHGTITDSAGNVTDTPTLNITVDTVAPDAAGDLQLTNDAGSTAVPVTTGSVINDATPVLSGTAEAGSVVIIRDGNTVLGSVTVGDNGNWSFTTPALGEGNHSLTTTVTDAAGNVSPATTPMTFSVDTSAPAAVSGLVVSNDAGDALTSGATSDDSTPTLSGNAEVGSVVSVYDGTVLLGTATVGSNGSWTFTPDAPLTNGQHNLTTTVTDAAGNVSPASPAFTVNIDAGVPTTNELIVVSDDSGSTFVQLENNSSTHDSTPIISGLAGANELITVYNGTTVLGTTTSDSSGQWSFTPATLADGTYAFHAIATNPTTGATADTPTITVTIDTVVPTAPTGVELTDPAGDPIPTGSSTNTNTPTLSGSGEPGGTVTISDGTTVLGTTTVDNDGNWSYTTPTLSDGDHSLTSTITDPAGNTGPASAPVTVNVDTQPPAAASGVQLTNDDGTAITAGGTTNDTTPTLSGTAEPGSTVNVTDGTTPLGTATVGSDGTWSFTPTDPLSEGSHSLTTTVTDPAGNTGPATTAVIVIVDTTAPAAASDLQLGTDQSGTTVPVTGGVTNDTTPVLSGRAEPGSTVTVSDNGTALGSVVVGNDGNWSFTSPTLGDGTHSLTTTVTDTAGNTGDASTPVNFTVDTSIPAAPGNVQLSNDEGSTPVPITSGTPTNDNTPVLSGTAPEGSVITVTDGGTVLGTVVVGSGGEWSFTPVNPLGEGNHSITATVTSPAGNTSAPSTPIVVNVDTTAPTAASGLQLTNDGSNTPIADGSTTNDTTPVLSGTAEPGSTVTVLDGTTVLGSATVASNGSWTFTPSTPLAAGDHSLTTTVTDAAGNQGPASDALTFTIDTTPPPVAADIVLSNDQSGTPVAITNGATNDTTPVLSGTAEVGSTVTVLDGDTVLGTALVDGDGNWTFTSPALSQGEHSLTTTVTNPIGNVSDPSAPVTFTVDTQAPDTATGLQFSNDSGTPIASGGSTNDTTPTLGGSAEAGSVVTVRDGNTILGSAAVDEDGIWTFTPATPLSEGSHSLTVTVTDPAGNVSAPTSAVVVIVDTTAPDVAGNLQLSNDNGGTSVPIANEGATNDTTPRLTGTADAGSVVTIYDGNTAIGSVSVGSNGSWSFNTPTLTEGGHSLTTTVTDAAGNIGPASPAIAFTVDLTPPAVATNVVLNNDAGSTPSAIASGSATNDTTPVLSGTAEVGSTITVRDGTTVLGTAIAGVGGAWSFTTPALSQGVHSLTATVTDTAGNTGSPTTAINFTVDTQAPNPATGLQLSNDSSGTPVAVTNGTTNDTTPVLSGTAEAGSVVIVSDGSNVLGSVTVGTNGSWSFTSPVLGEGAHSLTTTVTDPAGNVSAPSAAVAFTVDTTPPAAPGAVTLSNNNGSTQIPIASGTSTNDSTPIMRGTGDVGSTITVRDGTTVLGTAIVGSDGTWRYTPSPALAEGSHSLTATETDLAGNVGTPSTAIAFTVDTVAPTAVTDVVAKDDAGNTLTGVTNDSTPALSGTAEANSVIKIYDGTTLIGSTTTNGQGAWSFTTQTLSDGSHTLTVTATDAAGNVSTASNTVSITVDTTVPAAPDFVVNNNNVTPEVTIANGGYTNDNTPALSGTTTANSLVTIYDGSNAIGSVTANAQGVWSFTTTTLLDGSHPLSITVTDAAGNVSPSSAVVTVNVDTVAPDAATAVTLNNNEGNTLVPIGSGGITNDTTPELTGTATAGSIVKVYDGTTLLGSVAADGDGSWNFTTNTLTQGAHSLSVTVSDAAGNTSANSPAINFTVDSVAPTAATGLVLNNDNGSTPVPIANNGTTNDSTPVLSGSAEANSIVTILDGTTVLGTVTANAQGAWSFSPTLTDGIHTLSVTVKDAAGNTSGASSTITVTVDTVAPPAATNLTLTNDIGGGSVNIPNGGLTNDSTPVLSGSGLAGSIITISDQNGVLGSTTVGSGGTWTFTPATALADGTHTFSVVASDTAGNVSGTSTISATIDATPPTTPAGIIISNDEGVMPVTIAANSTTNDNTPFLSGTGEAGSIITILDGAAVLGSTAVGSNGQWSFTSPTLLDGTHTLSATAKDAAGNVSTASTATTFTVDTTAPVAATLTVQNDNGSTPVTVPNNATTNDNTPLLSGTAEAGRLVTIYDGTTVIGSTVATSGGTWSFSSPALTDGSHTLTATVTDEVGNVSSPSSNFTVLIDATAPQPVSGLLLQNNNGTPTTIANGGTTNDNTPAISGTAEANSIVRVYDGTTLVGSVQAAANGSWSITTSTLSDATHTLNVTATDAAGNVSSQASVTLTVDTSTPAGVLTFGVYNNANTTAFQVANNGYTNDNTPVLRGTGVAGTTINLYQDNVLIGTTIVAENGVWRFETSTVADGAHAYTVSVTNAAGTTSAQATPITVNVDTAPPSAITLASLTVTDNAGTSTGTLASGATTDDNTPSFSGTVDAGSTTVSIYDGTTLLGTATVTGTTWSFTPGTELSNGSHSFTFTVTDAAGNVSTASPAFTLDIEAGLPPATSTLQITDDNGSTLVNLPDGANTNDSTPVLSGATTAGNIVYIYDGTTELGSVTAGANGQWSFTTAQLPDGQHSFSVIVADSTGNNGVQSDAIAITIDTTAPVAVTNLAAANNNGSTPVPIANNGTTNDSTPQLTGTTEANGIVTIYDGNTVIGSTTASATGAWSFTSPTLSQGAHALSVTVTDVAGNVGPRSAAVNLTVDTVAPNAATLVVTNDVTSTTVPNGGSTNDSTPTLSGTAEANSIVTIYDGTTAIGSTTATGTGTWTFTPGTALTEGSHALTVRATDAAGNTSVASSTATVVVDTTAPNAVAGLAAANNNGSTPVAIANNSSTNDNTPALSGTAEAGSIVKIYDGSTLLGSVTASSTGAWSYTSSTLLDGLHTLNVTATDAAGNVSPNASITFTVVTSAPAGVSGLVVNDNVGAVQGNVANGGSTDDTTPTLSGTATAGNTVVISEGTTVLGSVVVAANGTWSFTTAALSEGSHPLSVTVRDAAGNSSAASNFTVVVDTVAPTTSTLVVTNDNTSTTVPNGGSTNDNTPTLSGTAEANGIVIIRDGTTVLGSVTAGSNGAWTYTTSTLTEGSHPLSVTVTDAAGNVSGTTTATVIVDTTAPVAVTGLAAANNNGSTPVAIANNGSTNDNTPALSGTAEAGSTVIIRDGATNIIGSVTAGSNGSWSFTTPTLADGAHTFNVTARDAAGNVSPTASITLTVDTAAPAPVANLVVTDDFGSTQGALANGAVTDDNTPTLSGTAEANAIVTIYDGTTVLGSTTASGTGAWSFTTAALSNGTHPLSVTVKDAAGNVSTASATVSITVDTVAPNASTLVITNDVTNTTVPSGGTTNDSTPTLSGVAEAGSKVSIYDGTTLLGTATAGSNGAWTFTTATLGQGSHPINVTVTDTAGNVSGTTSATVTIDTVAPVAVTGLAAANNNGSTPVAIAANSSTNDNTPQLTGTAEAGSIVKVYDGTSLLGSVTAGSNGAWSFTSPTVADGSHTFNVTATDAAGNVSPNASITFTIDTAAPAPVTNLVITDDVGTIQGTLSNGSYTDDRTPTLSGTAEANAIVTIYDGTTVLGSVTASGTGAWTYTTTSLSNGTHPLSVTVKDAAGNVSSASATVSIIVDTVAPTASTLVITNDVTNTTVPSGGSTNDSTPTLSGTAEANSKVSIYDGSTLLGTATAGSNGAWTFTTGVLTQGSHPISVTVTDAAGNVSGSTSATVTIDTVSPAAVTNLVAANNNGSTAVTIPNNGSTNDSTPLLTGSGEIGAKISVYDGTTLLGTTTVGSNGTWSFISTTLADGAHTLNITATDAAGNVSPTVSTTLTIDTVAPAPVTNLVITDDVGSVQGPLANGAVTDDTTPTLSGTAEANAIVTIYDGTTVLGSVTASNTGAWTFTTAALSQGTHPLSVTVKDAAGNTSTASATVSITVDTTAPTASTLVITNDVTNTTVPSGGSTNDSTPTLSGTAEAGSKVSIYDGSLLLGTVTAGSNGAWTFTTAVLSQGSHPISVTVTDTAGNLSGTTSATVIIDTVAPVAVTSLVAANNNGSTAVTIPNNGITNDNTPLLSGNGEVGAIVRVYDGSALLGSTTVGSNGTWSLISTTLSNGTHTINVTQTDAAGNVSPTASTTLTIDTVAPTATTLTITDDTGTTPVTLANGAYTKDTTPTLSGTAEVGAIVTIYDGATILGSVTVGSGGTWTYTTAVLANGAHPLSTTVTDAAGNVSTGNTTATVNVDTVAPVAVTNLAINAAGTTVTGSGEVGDTVTVRDASGNSLGTATVGAAGTWSVTLSTAQTTGASLSVIQTDRAGNVSPSASLTGAIRIVATNDTNEVDYSTTNATINNGTTSVSHTALANVGLGSIVNASVLSNGNAYVFSVGTDDTRTITLNGSVSGISLISTYSLYLYEQQTNGTWLLINTRGSYLSTGLISLGTQTGANVTYTNLGTGTYAVVIGSNVSVSLLPTTTISTVSDYTTMAVTVAATVTGNLLTNDTSSVAGTVPSGTLVTTVSGSAVSTTANTVINTTYGTLTIDSHGNYTYALKAGLNIDTLPTADTFTYSVRDASGAVTSATLTVTLHNGAATSLLAANSLLAETTSTSEHDASGSIYGDSTTHTGTLSITNEHGDVTTVHSVGTTSIAGDYGVLSIAANGSYTYTLNAGVDGQSLLHKEVFSYTLAATDGTITTHSFTIDLHPTITGTAGADTITGGAYNDTITTGAGADTLVYHLLASADSTGGNGHDTWTDFNVAQGDKIDVSNLLIGWNDSTSNINDFVKVDHTSDGNTVLSIDRDGTGTAYSSTQLVTLEGVNVSLEELLQQPHQNTTV
ncbi:Ig-like domain-containing protein [Pantoea sp. EA-12]|uniref:Ig-like domain-containing protein n=1 Tax=Pantoea sp. EA-12 TaxID=3043303 RepID=UPI0024B53D20|nr:Ig-like domain-containing protein [Pantoea sp. EA-12]MDI9221142.1 Ig-like domain-containing protein [Pantoea sp. EA-12]